MNVSVGLAGAYCMKKNSEGKNASLRPPSYTDRILCYSQPASQQMLKIDKYDMCDAIKSSDHRPVAASIDVLVKDTWMQERALEELEVLSRLMKIRLYDIAIQLCDHLEPNLPALGSLSTINPTKLRSGGAPNHSGTHHKSFFSSAPGGGGEGGGLSCTVYFPLRNEDPLLPYRKQVLMNQALTLWSNRDEGLWTARNMEYLHSFKLDPPASKVIEFRSLMCPERARHALLRFTDKAGVEVGQGLVPLDFSVAHNDVFRTGTGETSSAGPSMHGGQTNMDENLFSDRAPQAFYAINLTSGGVFKGTATFGMRISQCSTKA